MSNRSLPKLKEAIFSEKRVLCFDHRKKAPLGYKMMTAGGSSSGQIWLNDSNDILMANFTGEDIHFGTSENFNAPSFYRMSIKSDGNIGIGVQLPNELLEIGGTGRAFFGNGGGGSRTSLLIDGVNGSYARIESYDYGTATGIDLVINTVGGGDVGIGTGSPTAKLSVNGSANKPGGGSWSVFSDRRAKTKIAEYTLGLEKLLKFRPVSFQYKEKFGWGNDRYVGLIAQEVEAILPSMVKSKELGKIKDVKEVDPNELLFLLINSVKELKIQKDLLKEQLKMHSAQIKELNNINLANHQITKD